MSNPNSPWFEVESRCTWFNVLRDRLDAEFAPEHEALVRAVLTNHQYAITHRSVTHDGLISIRAI